MRIHDPLKLEAEPDGRRGAQPLGAVHRPRRPCSSAPTSRSRPGGSSRRRQSRRGSTASTISWARFLRAGRASAGRAAAADAQSRPPRPDPPEMLMFGGLLAQLPRARGRTQPRRAGAVATVCRGSRSRNINEDLPDRVGSRLSGAQGRRTTMRAGRRSPARSKAPGQQDHDQGYDPVIRNNTDDLHGGDAAPT